ncbi:ATP-dependent DNA helicase [Desulfobulbus rhabdoformis]|uniref:ATP-dependent DNA helicase n=1 Tax=Desulfobulbus rhabdoformis TaxID=34032 RepID=UPI001963CF53|nr:ATP-dependent DNA helicase [Desulfobulbus rhabdoformis]MBM9616267.1 ATP-dependent DNA helicase [Desulfobulbus rhabdoformis]
MEQFFGPQGILAQKLAGYECRPDQLRMAQAVDDLLMAGDDPSEGMAASLVIEAETGLGKTLAYLIPAVLSGKRVVVSTHTRNLQDQILLKEIPLILKHIDPGLNALCVKGRQNYLCLYRYHQLLTERADGALEAEEKERLEAWLPTTFYGERAELDWLSGSSPLWHKICCQSHFCLGANCPEAMDCFLNRLRRDAANSRVLIVNHHLLFSDLAVRRSGYGEVLPRYESVIFDEAHHVEQVATSFFGFSFSRYQVVDLAADLERSAQSELSEGTLSRLLTAIGRVLNSVERFAAVFPMERGRFPLTTEIIEQPSVRQAHNDLHAALNHLMEALDPLGGGDSVWRQYLDRTQDLTARLERLLAEQFDDLPAEEIPFTYWFERSERNLTLCATPVDVALELQASLFSTVRHCIFTSATLTTGGKFTYFLDRVGLSSETPTLSLASPFDYAGRTLIYVPPPSCPEPNAPGYVEAIHQNLEQLIHHARGRSLCLFTSFAAMDRAASFLEGRLPYPLLVQGDAPRRRLLETFSRQTETVLLAVASFWEGVDIPGEALSLVVIDKLPFEVPSDPVIMARVNRIKALGGNPFIKFQIPRAILTLRQGVGRLMRTAEDRGVIALLDTRLFTKGYGRQFRQSLPPSPLTREMDEVAAFFEHLYS